MDENGGALPPRLQEIVQDFADSHGREKLDLLLEYADSLPPLPDWLAERREDMEPVNECMTSVSVYAEVDDGHMYFHFDVPQEAPTVRGFAAIMGQGLGGARPEEVLAVPGAFFRDMGLDEVLTQQRLGGIAAMLAHLKRLAVEAI